MKKVINILIIINMILIARVFYNEKKITCDVIVYEIGKFGSPRSVGSCMCHYQEKEPVCSIEIKKK